MQNSYSEIPSLDNIYLEDSYVLTLNEDKSRLEWMLEVVLTEQHPNYQLPPSNEYYCYHKALLGFPSVSKIIWHEKHFNLYHDANGDVDYGNIDIFYFQDDVYHLEGDWGRVTMYSGIPYLTLIIE